MEGMRKLMLECPNFVREAVLTDSQIDIYQRVRGRGLSGITSSDIAIEDNITIQAAHMRLSILAKKKYLRKVEGVCESGGKEFTFLAIEF